jgi:Leucine-rich repeat (LRR) protein
VWERSEVGANKWRSAVRTGVFDGLDSLGSLTISDYPHLKSLQSDLFVTLANADTIELTRCSVSHIAPGVFTPLKCLRALDLGSNALYQSPAMAELTQSESLNVSSNRITNVDFDGTSLNRTLRYLDLGDNKLERLQPVRFCESCSFTITGALV